MLEGTEAVAEAVLLRRFARLALQPPEPLVELVELGAAGNHRSGIDETGVRVFGESRLARGEIRADVSDVHAWAIMGMNVFLGLRYGVWNDEASPDQVADVVAEMLARGIGTGQA